MKRSGFKPRQPSKANTSASSSDNGEKSAPNGGKRAKTARKPTKSSLEVRLDIVFSLYVRLRDAVEGGMTRCISCGRVLPFGQMQCGHYFSRHNMATRWDEDNCHSECVRCNCYDSDHLEGYEKSLVEKIGLERYEDLCARAHGMRKWGDAELRGMIRHYTAEVRRLGGEKGISVSF